MWQGAGSGIMIFYANFMDIPQEVMEACQCGRLYGVAAFYQDPSAAYRFRPVLRSS